MNYFLLPITCLSLSMCLSQPATTGQKSLSDFGPSNVVNVGNTTIVDGVYVKTTVPQRKFVNYEHVREADVVWSKRVWSYIDVREKMNHPLFFPPDKYEFSADTANYPDGIHIINGQRYSLWNIIKHNVMEATFTPFYVSNPNIYPIPQDPNDPWELDDLKNDGYDFKYPLLPKVPGGNYWTDKFYREELFPEGLNIGPLGTSKITETEVKDEEGEAIMTNEQAVDESGKPIFDETGAPVMKAKTTRQVDKVIYKSQDIVRYHLKTDWFFDKERSLLDHRIIAIAPVIYALCDEDEGDKKADDSGTETATTSEGSSEDPEGDVKKAKEAFDKFKLEFSKLPDEKRDTVLLINAELDYLNKQNTLFEITGQEKALEKNGKLISDLQKRKTELESAKKEESSEDVGPAPSKPYCYKELFWLYFPQMRPVLQKYYTYNDKNDAQWMSFDDLFWKTRYSQVIYKESNVYDRKVESYRKGMDALIESDKIKENIRTIEHDVWNF